MGYLLLIPFRRLRQDPRRILSPYLRPAMRVLEIGPGMGYFTLPMAQMVGPDGHIVAVDIQERMLTRLRTRAQRAGLADRISTRLAGRTSLEIADLNGTIDFALAFAVVHEIPYREQLFRELAVAMRPGGTLLMADPKGHCSQKDFEEYQQLARQAGFHTTAHPEIYGSHAAVMTITNYGITTDEF